MTAPTVLDPCCGSRMMWFDRQNPKVLFGDCRAETVIDGLVVDLFAGGGGASTGLAWALGRDPDIAINHDAEALALHAANHPRTRHLQNDITRVLPLEATGGRRVSILHASPDCTHFSKAKGGKPRSQHIRDLAWVVIRWAEDTRPTLITLENVEEFLTWGPLDRGGQPIKAQAGQTFRAWARRLRRLGYTVAWRLLRACDYGAPTTRKRLFVVARRDGGRIAWPRPTHGAPESPEVQTGKLLPWRTAAECIDWSIQSRSIFDRAKPLALNTQRRIAEGLRQYVFQAAEPFILSYYGPKTERDFRGQTLRQPLLTQTCENRFGLISPFIQHCQHGSAKYGVMPAIVKYYGNEQGGVPVTDPLHTITSKDRMGLVTAHLEGVDDRAAETRDWLREWGVIGPDDEAVVCHAGQNYRISDICMRMLAPRELYNAQGFPPDYQIDTPYRGKPLTKTAQVRMCGNSVPPVLVCALVSSNGPETWRPKKLSARPHHHQQSLVAAYV